MPQFDLKNYIPVQERINRFWAEHPNGNIVTALASDPDEWGMCRYRAEVYRDIADARPAATGYAFEKAGEGGMANRTSHEENCETSAIGRALANLGYATSHEDRASREEMEKVQRASEPVTPEQAARIEQRHVYNEILQAASFKGVKITEGMTFDAMCEAIAAKKGTPPEKKVGDPLASYQRILTCVKNMPDDEPATQQSNLRAIRNER